MSKLKYWICQLLTVLFRWNKKTHAQQRCSAVLSSEENMTEIKKSFLTKCQQRLKNVYMQTRTKISTTFRRTSILASVYIDLCVITSELMRTICYCITTHTYDAMSLTSGCFSFPTSFLVDLLSGFDGSAFLMLSGVSTRTIMSSPFVVIWDRK